MRFFSVALLCSWLLWLRGLSVLRLPAAARSLTVATRRRLAGVLRWRRSRGQLAERRAPSPSGWGWRSGRPRTCVWGSDFSPEAACGDSPTWESSARLSREAVALVRWRFLPAVHSHCNGLVKWSWRIGCSMLGGRWGARAAGAWSSHLFRCRAGRLPESWLRGSMLRLRPYSSGSERRQLSSFSDSRLATSPCLVATLFCSTLLCSTLSCSPGASMS